MKDLSIEEKAQRYDEAIELAKDSFNYSDYPGFIRADVVFPELKMSEDERIRKSLIDMLKNDEKCYLKEIAWLEKQGKKEWSKEMGSLCLEACSLLRAYSEETPYNSQLGQKIKRVEAFLGDLYHEAFYPSTYNPRPDIISPEWSDKDETIIKTMCNEGNLKPSEIQWLNNLCYRVKQQKPANKVEPKFKIEKGKWYVGIKTFALRGKLLIKENGIYYAREDRAVIGENEALFIDKHDGNASEFLKLWTIQDAKDGDVLATLDYILIFKKHLKDNGGVSYCHYDLTASNPQFVWVEDRNWYFGKEAVVSPATKEQRDLLFQKMKESGYEWDAEKKELKKIEDESSWGEEDKEMINNIIDYMTPMPIFFESTNGKSGKEYTQEFVKNAINWLKSLKPQLQWKPSDEQIIALRWVLNNVPYNKYKEEISGLLDQIKDL